MLKVLIQRYIRDGQPVGSRTLSKESGLDLSPATIRNIMSDLEDLGLIAAPHTSAGRIPTQRGYRLFVDTLVRFKPVRDREVKELQHRIVGQDADTDSLAKGVSDMLSRITSLAGVITTPKGQHAVLRQIEFLPLSEHRILAILVINDREVQNRILYMEGTYTSSELQQASRLGVGSSM